MLSKFCKCIISQWAKFHLNRIFCHWLILSVKFKMQNKYIFDGVDSAVSKRFMSWIQHVWFTYYVRYQINIHLNLFTDENWPEILVQDHMTLSVWITGCNIRVNYNIKDMKLIYRQYWHRTINIFHGLPH